ncbi:MAG: type II toxin-antitoxin system VapC family toxin [Solirubrobacteraceae bacterium]
MSAPGRSSAPSQIVIDASALVELLLRTAVGGRVASLLGSARMVAPDLINIETLQAVRGLQRAGKLSIERAAQAVARLAESPIARIPTGGLIAEVWSLRSNLSAYDASYVALARALDCPLLTTDAPLRRAPALGVAILTVG